MLTYSWLFLSSDVSALPFAVMKTGRIYDKGREQRWSGGVRGKVIELLRN